MVDDLLEGWSLAAPVDRTVTQWVEVKVQYGREGPRLVVSSVEEEVADSLVGSKDHVQSVWGSAPPTLLSHDLHAMKDQVAQHPLEQVTHAQLLAD